MASFTAGLHQWVLAVAITTGSSDLLTTVLSSLLYNGGFEHDSLAFNVPNLPRNVLEILPEVRVEDLTDSVLRRTFPVYPHDQISPAVSPTI